jgi:hypothetical protein
MGAAAGVTNFCGPHTNVHGRMRAPKPAKSFN